MGKPTLAAGSTDLAESRPKSPFSLKPDAEVNERFNLAGAFGILQPSTDGVRLRAFSWQGAGELERVRLEQAEEAESGLLHEPDGGREPGVRDTDDVRDRDDGRDDVAEGGRVEHTLAHGLASAAKSGSQSALFSADSPMPRSPRGCSNGKLGRRQPMEGTLF